jgi:ParB-like chromosome segregation protein Spo0J
MWTNVQLGELKPNPFKKEIQNGSIDPEKLEYLQDSMETDKVWEWGVVRKNSDGDYELVFGHHRLQAAIAAKGKKFEMTVQVEN